MKCIFTKSALLLCIVLAGTAARASAQQQGLDFNAVYKFPVSLGVEYRQLSPFTDYHTEITSYYDLALLARIPLPSLPILQPFLRLGTIQFTPPDRNDQLKWTHTHWYAMPGIAYANRFSKNFEIGADLAVGMSEAVFPSLDPSGPRGSPTVIATLGAHVSLDPSYSFAIEVSPSLTYMQSLTPLDRFNGLVLGIAFSVGYRFGEDPDSPQAILRSIKFGDITFPPMFAGMQSWYAQHDFTSLDITNAETFDITDVEVSFYQKGFMDSPTKLASIPTLGAGKSAKVNVKATFNNEVFNTNGITPLTGEISVKYLSRGKAGEQTQPVQYELLDRSSITWADDRKAAAYITKADSALQNYASFIRQSVRDQVVPGFSEPMQIAMEVFYGLKEIGVIYQLEATASSTSASAVGFVQAQSDPTIVDHIRLPRETLKKRTGDCSDLTVLYCALLEAVGIRTGFITVPGHIYAVFGTGLPSKSYRDVHPDQTMTLIVEDEVWVPVEVTMIGTADFLAAWRKGIEEFRAFDGDPGKRTLHLTAKSQEEYRPVVLREQDLGLQYGSAKTIADNFGGEIARLVDTVVASYAEIAKRTGAKGDYNRLGIMAATYGRYDQAEQAFVTALSIDRNYISAMMNSGNVFFLRQKYPEALKIFHAAEEVLAGSGAKASRNAAIVSVNISRCYYELEDFARAKEYIAKAAAIDPALADPFAYIKTAGDSTRAAAAAPTAGVIYAEGEE